MASCVARRAGRIQIIGLNAPVIWIGQCEAGAACRLCSPASRTIRDSLDSIGSLLPCAGRAGAGRPRPASAGRKTVAARTLAALVVAASKGGTWATDARRTDAPVVAWDLRGSQRPNSPRGIAAPVFLLRVSASVASRRQRDSAARGPLQTGAAGQHRHGAGGQRVILRRVIPDLLESPGSGSRRPA